MNPGLHRLALAGKPGAGVCAAKAAQCILPALRFELVVLLQRDVGMLEASLFGSQGAGQGEMREGQFGKCIGSGLGAIGGLHG